MFGEKSQIVEEILSNHFEGLNEPVSVSLGLFPEGDYRYSQRDKVVTLLRENGIDAVLSSSPEVTDITKFVVEETGIRMPLLAPADAKAATKDVVKILTQNNIEIMGYAQPLSKSNMLYAQMGDKSVFKEIPVSDSEFCSKKIAEAMTMPEAEFASKEASLFRGGTLGNRPYGIASSFCRARDFAYATDDIEIAKCFSGANESSWAGRANYKKVNGLAYGFVYEYEKAADQKFYGNYGIENRKSGGHYETPVFEHRNKLKGVYLNVDGRVVQIAGENGKYFSKEWEKFAEMHNSAIYLSDEAAITRHNNLKFAAENEKVVSYVKQKPPVHPVDVVENAAVKDVREQITAATVKLDAKIAVKGGIAASSVGAKTGKKSKILAKAATANAKFDKAVDRAIEKGTLTLNNSKAGQLYEKTTMKIGETKVAQAVSKETSKVVSVVAETAIGKAATKVMVKTVGSAVGKSVLKKIPLVSIGAGAYFAWERVKNGEFKAAGCEVLSGVAGCFPGIGTGISVAIDTGLVVNDVQQASHTVQSSDASEQKVTLKPVPKDLSKKVEERLKKEQVTVEQDNTAVHNRIPLQQMTYKQKSNVR
ncbi:MAG: hypothetical protein NC218_06255 [Acetobacter sp.]|nr:hypothetical protein [Acetobacter sp.]